MFYNLVKLLTFFYFSQVIIVYMHILVLTGGNSREREVSLRSAASVIKALEAVSIDVSRYDPKDGLAGILNYKNIDVVLPILHGQEGEDGKIQAFLEKHGFRYLGSDSNVSNLCFYKDKFKIAVSKLGINIPHGQVVSAKEFTKATLAKKPFVIKPLNEGSSINTYIVRDPQQIPKGITETFSIYRKMLLEELIDGVEVTVPVLGDKALPVIEIVPPLGKEFDYENKYNGSTQEFCPPIRVSDSEQKKCQNIAEKIHKHLGVRHLSRTDMILRGKEIFVLELNTMPGMTDESLFPKAAAAAGVSMPELMQKFIDLALKG